MSKDCTNHEITPILLNTVGGFDEKQLGREPIANRVINFSVVDVE
jgi:hypothetical protein